MRNKIEVASYTHAMKARGILRQRGFICDVQKTSTQNGCAFFVYVNDDADKIRRILSSSGIAVIRW